MNIPLVKGQKGRLKVRPWGMPLGMRGRIHKVSEPGQGSGWDAEFRARGWRQPVRVKKGEVALESKAAQVVDSMLEVQRPWTTKLTRVIVQLRQAFIRERVAGFTRNGRREAPCTPEEAALRWERAYPHFVDFLRRLAPDDPAYRWLGIEGGQPAEVPGPFDG